MAPRAGEAALPVRTSQLATQLLLLTAMVAGFRAVVRTSASPSARWFFDVADTGHIAAFRHGVRLGRLTAVSATVLLLLPLHAAAWGPGLASLHAVNSVAVGWLLIEVACADAEQPLIRTIPPSDTLNTTGAVFLGAVVIGVAVLAALEHAALTSPVASVLFPGVTLALAMWVHGIHERDHRDAAAAGTR